eukprot:g1908.t1
MSGTGLGDGASKTSAGGGGGLHGGGMDGRSEDGVFQLFSQRMCSVRRQGAVVVGIIFIAMTLLLKNYILLPFQNDLYTTNLRLHDPDDDPGTDDDPLDNASYVAHATDDDLGTYYEPLPESCVDLECHYVWDGAFYHRLVDCLMPFSAELLKASSTAADPNTRAVCTNKFMEPIFAAFGNVSRLFHPQMFGHDNCSSCTSVVPLQRTAADSALAFDAMTSLLSGALPANITSVLHPDIILISRSGWRSFATTAEDALFRSLSRVGRTARYFGNETLLETAAMFYGAKAVVHYHGAVHRWILEDFSASGTPTVRY